MTFQGTSMLQKPVPKCRVINKSNDGWCRKFWRDCWCGILNLKQRTTVSFCFTMYRWSCVFWDVQELTHGPHHLASCWLCERNRNERRGTKYTEPGAKRSLDRWASIFGIVLGWCTMELDSDSFWGMQFLFSFCATFGASRLGKWSHRKCFWYLFTLKFLIYVIMSNGDDLLLFDIVKESLRGWKSQVVYFFFQRCYFSRV